jgi:hypothetical protein
MSSSDPELGDDTPDDTCLIPDEIHDLIRRAHWQSAKSVEDVAPEEVDDAGGLADLIRDTINELLDALGDAGLLASDV